jgi:thioredoxin-related protein
MKKLSLICFCFTVISFGNWQPSFEKAKQIAKSKHQLILLNFSGSDWCGPCIRMRKEIFDSETFSVVADSLLVLVNADFPRNKKNQLEKSIQVQNDMLADKYNAEGKFPFTLLLDENGKIIKSWDGLPKETAIEFAAEVKAIVNAKR